MRNWSVPIYIQLVAVPRIIYTTSQNACVVSGNFVLLCGRWCSGVTAVQPHGRRKYLRTACRRFEYLDELSPPGTSTVTVLYRLLEVIYFFTTLVAHDWDITLSLYTHTGWCVPCLSDSPPARRAGWECCGHDVQWYCPQFWVSVIS